MTRVWLSYLENGSRDVSELYQMKLQQLERELFDAETKFTLNEPPQSAPVLSAAVDPEEVEAKAEFAARLRDAFDHNAEATTISVSNRLRVSPDQLKSWLDGTAFPRAAQRRELAKILSVQADWLEKGAGATPWEDSEDVEGTLTVRTVPVISWSHAGAAAHYDEMPKHWHGAVATTSRDRKAFAVTVEGDCMEPKFFAGDRVVLEPNAELRSGKPVVAKLVDDAVQLRIYTKMPSGLIRLASLKPDIYPTVEYSPTSFHWIYPVRELVRSV